MKKKYRKITSIQVNLFSLTLLRLLPLAIEDVIEELNLLIPSEVEELTLCEECHGEVHYSAKLFQAEIHDPDHLLTVVVECSCTVLGGSLL